MVVNHSKLFKSVWIMGFEMFIFVVRVCVHLYLCVYMCVCVFMCVHVWCICVFVCVACHSLIVEVSGQTVLRS